LKTTSGTSGRLYQALFYVKLKVMTKGKFIREKNKRRIAVNFGQKLLQKLGKTLMRTRSNGHSMA